MTNRKLHTRFRLAPWSVILSCYKFKFFRNLAHDGVSVNNASEGWFIELCPMYQYQGYRALTCALARLCCYMILFFTVIFCIIGLINIDITAPATYWLPIESRIMMCYKLCSLMYRDDHNTAPSYSTSLNWVFPVVIAVFDWPLGKTIRDSQNTIDA